MSDDFWGLSTGESAADKTEGGSYEKSGGNMKPIPDGTSVLAAIDEAKWDKDTNGKRFISLRWTVLAPKEFENRKVFQKIWCLDDDPRKDDAEKAKDKAKRMLFAIDKNAGGALVASGKAPNDNNLAKAFTDKQMQITLNIWAMDGADGKPMSGNWVSAVSPKAGATAKKAAPKQHDVDDDIPF